MRGVIRLFDTLFRFFGRLIFTPTLLGWMIGAVLFGAMIGFIIGGVVAMTAFGPPLGHSAWEWVIIAPPVFIGGVFGHTELVNQVAFQPLRNIKFHSSFPKGEVESPPVRPAGGKLTSG